MRERTEKSPRRQNDYMFPQQHTQTSTTGSTHVRVQRIGELIEREKGAEEWSGEKIEWRKTIGRK